MAQVSEDDYRLARLHHLAGADQDVGYGARIRGHQDRVSQGPEVRPPSGGWLILVRPCRHRDAKWHESGGVGHRRWNRATLVRIENDEQSPRDETLVALAGALGRAVGDLLAGEPAS